MLQQLPLFEPPSSWSMPIGFPDLSSADVIAVDTETRDPYLPKHGPGWFRNNADAGEIVGVSVATRFFKGYFPVGHANGPNLDKRMVMRWLRGELSRPRQVKVFHNALYDLGWLRREGVTVEGPVHDTMLAAPLLDEHRKSYSLNNLGRDWLGEHKDEQLLREAAAVWGFGKKVKENLWRLPAKQVGPYAEQDAALTLRLYDHCLARLEQEGLIPVFELECQLLPLLLEMRWRGVRVDVDKALQMGETFKIERDAALTKLRDVTGMREIDIWSNKSLELAYDRCKVTYPRLESGSSSFTAGWLENQDDRLSSLVVRARKMDRAENVFSSKMIVEHAFEGRIHCQFHQLRNDEHGTVSYRFSSSDPNLQQVPARDPWLGPLVRSVFIPEPGEKWCKFDYSQQEPRLTVHYAVLLNLPGAQAAADYLRNDPNADYHTLVRDMVRMILPEFERKPAKTINLGKAYGMGLAKLCEKLGVSEEQGKLIVDAYDQGFPIIKRLTAECSNKAEARGFIRTIAGHRCRFNQWEARDWDLAKLLAQQDSAEKMLEQVQRAIENARTTGASVPRAGVRRAGTFRAMNRLIQGSAAGQTKMAMRDVWNYTEAGQHVLLPLIQVHDELNFSLAEPRLLKIIQEIMVNAVPLQVPVKCDPAVGPDWGHVEDEFEWAA